MWYNVMSLRCPETVENTTCDEQQNVYATEKESPLEPEVPRRLSSQPVDSSASPLHVPIDTFDAAACYNGPSFLVRGVPALPAFPVVSFAYVACAHRCCLLPVGKAREGLASGGGRVGVKNRYAIPSFRRSEGIVGGDR